MARRRNPIGQVLYEMHIGTFTPRGHVGSGDGATARARAISA